MEETIVCGKCRNCITNAFEFDYRTLNWHEYCVLADEREIGLTSRQQEYISPDWCPLKVGNGKKNGWYDESTEDESNDG